MKTFIANFGRENYEWPECLARGTIATMNEVRVHGFWEADDREAYIQDRMKGKTAAGITPTRPVASRWFNLMSIISQSSSDLWVHRQKDQIWWTISRVDEPTFETKTEPTRDNREVVVCHKPCDPWSNANRKGNRLEWNGLHAKAREFLSTESTLQQLNDDYAAYAVALVNGDDLTSWHSRSDWKAKVAASHGKQGAATIFNGKQRAAARMAMTAFATVAGANGQQALRTIKNKELLFSSTVEFERYIIGLIDMQEGLCALTGLDLQFDGESDDAEMLCSLDRIDSNGHYAPDNLQVVCRFANRWKSNGDDQDFRRLMAIVRSIDGNAPFGSDSLQPLKIIDFPPIIDGKGSQVA